MNIINKIKSALLAALTVSGLAACSQIAATSPEGAVKAFVSAVANNQVNTAIGLVDLSDVKQNEMTAAKGKVQMLVGRGYAYIQEKGGLKKIETRLVSKTDTTATVSNTLWFKNGTSETETVRLKREGATWKIVIGGGGGK